MVWKADQEFRPESTKIVWEVAPYLRGRGLDVGAGTFKILPHAISVDNGHHEIFGQFIKPDVKVQDAEDLSVFGSQSMDFVYSSHLLEHLVNPDKALKEWWRLLKPKGVLVMYLPHEDLYPKMGEPGANTDHKHNLNETKVIEWMKDAGKWDLEVCEVRDQDEEYSFLMVFRKKQNGPHEFSYRRRKPEKTACVVRYGAFGDMMMASSVWAGLKKQGYHVTVFASLPGAEVITEDPNIDKIVLFDKDQVPNADLGNFWGHQKNKFDKFVNLSESVEGTFLAIKGRSQFEWPAGLRHKYMNHNYVQFSHEIAGIPHSPAVKFYPTLDEKQWASKERKKMGKGPVVMWSLAGSSVHKTWSGLDNIIASILTGFRDAHIVLVGGPECKILEAGWENEPRVHETCGKWSIRQSLAFITESDLIIGPETGVMNAASHDQVRKILFLSHSTHKNLSRDWENCTAIHSGSTNCPGRGNNEAPACHQLHYGWEFCKKDENSGVAQCQADIPVGAVWENVYSMLNEVIDAKKD